MAYLTPQGSYYEGDRAHALDVAVPPRPSYLHKWVNDAWVLGADPQLQTLGVKEQRTRALEDLAASDPETARVVNILKTAGLI